MNKLISFKEWLSVPDFAAYLSKSTSEAFSEADILALAMDGKITLSVRFSDEVPAVHEGTLTQIHGVYDLKLEGDALATIDRKVHELIGGTKPDGYFTSSTFIVKDEGGKTFRLLEFDVGREWVASIDGKSKVFSKKYDNQERLNNYSPASSLPECAVLVIRSSEIARMKGIFEEKHEQKAGDTQERVNTLAAKRQGKPRTAADIQAAFPNAKWGDKLTKCTSRRYQWLEGTWIHKGSKQPGDATTFNPAKLCAAAVSRRFLTLIECDRAITEHFPDWHDDWEKESDLLRN